VARGRLPVVVGGTGLYLRALLSGIFEGGASDEATRRRLQALGERHGDLRLHRLLARRDPGTAARVSPRDRIRVIRALEVVFLTGRSISEHHETGSSRPLEGFDSFVLVLAPDRAELRAAVEGRTRQMLEAGLVEEVRGLLSQGLSPGLRPFQAIGYRQALRVVRGELTLGEAERDIVTETMRYAKRQMTWFRHQLSAQWCPKSQDAFDLTLDWLARRTEG